MDDAESSSKRARGPGRPFQPGQSGNPGGRAKKLEELTERIGRWTDELLLRLHGIAMTGEHKDSVPAIKLMLAYRYGNPATVITGENGEAVRIGVVMMPPESDA